MALSAAEMQMAVIQNLPEKTGKSLAQWIKIAKNFQLPTKNEIIKKLKTDYGLGHVQAQTVVWRLDGENPYLNTEGYEKKIFKHTLKSFLKLKKQILGLSTDVTVKPCKTYIPFFRKTQFAILTEKQGVLILGLNLEKEAYPDLTEAKKLGGSDRINKMIRVDSNNKNQIKALIKKSWEKN